MSDELTPQKDNAGVQMDYNTAVLGFERDARYREITRGYPKRKFMFLQTVRPEDRDAVLAEAREKYKRLESGMPFGPDLA